MSININILTFRSSKKVVQRNHSEKSNYTVLLVPVYMYTDSAGVEAWTLIHFLQLKLEWFACFFWYRSGFLFCFVFLKQMKQEWFWKLYWIEVGQVWKVPERDLDGFDTVWCTSPISGWGRIWRYISGVLDCWIGTTTNVELSTVVYSYSIFGKLIHKISLVQVEPHTCFLYSPVVMPFVLSGRFTSWKGILCAYILVNSFFF